MAEKLGEAHDSNEEIEFAGLENEIRIRDFLKELILAGDEGAKRIHPTKSGAFEAAQAFQSGARKRSADMPDSNNAVMRVTGENVKINEVQSVKDAEGAVGIQTTIRQLGAYASRLFKYRGVSSRLEILDDEKGFITHSSILGQDLSGYQVMSVGNDTIPGVTVVIEPRLLIPCQTDVEIESLLIEQAGRRVAAMTDLKGYSARYPDIIANLSALELEIVNADPQRHFELQHVDKLRQLGQRGIEFSSQSDRHADVLNSAIAETLTRDRELMINGVAYVVDDEHTVVQHDVRQFRAKLVDVVSSIPMANEITGQSLAVSATAVPDYNQLFYIPLAKIKSLYI